MLRIALVLVVVSGAAAADDAARNCKGTTESETRGSSMISTRHVTVTAPGVLETFSAAKIADAPDTVMLAADDWGAGVEEGTQSQENSKSTLMPLSRLQTFGLASGLAYSHTVLYYACILMAGFLLAATTHGLHCSKAESMAPGSNKDKVGKLHHCKEVGSGDANETDAFGCTSLHVAAHGGSVDAVRALLAAKADANVREAWDETPLHFAARAGHAEVCAALLESGAEANVLNASGCTPLVEAATAGKRESCSMLLDHGCHAGGISDEQLPPMLSMLMLSKILAGGQDESGKQSHQSHDPFIRGDHNQQR